MRVHLPDGRLGNFKAMGEFPKDSPEYKLILELVYPKQSNGFLLSGVAFIRQGEGKAKAIMGICYPDCTFIPI